MICFQVTEEQGRNKPPVPVVREGIPIEVHGRVACVRIGLTGYPTYIPLSNQHQEALKTLPSTMSLEQLKPLGRLDVKDIRGTRTLVAEEDNEGNALVLVSCQPGVKLNGSGENVEEIVYTAASYTEEYSEKSHRIRKRYNPFPSLGVDVMAFGGNEQEYLVSMVPGASFKMFRGGDVNGSWSNMTVVWTGEHLRVYPRYKKAAAN
jgi:hypothetical protein